MGYQGEKKKQYQREWIAARRSKWFSNKSCVKCGSTQQLELDHIDPATKVHHSIWSWSWARIEEETSKCQVLCNSCHKVKTFGIDLPRNRGYDPEAHGANRYRRGCRCDICRAAGSAERQFYRLKAKVGKAGR